MLTKQRRTVMVAIGALLGLGYVFGKDACRHARSNVDFAVVALATDGTPCAWTAEGTFACFADLAEINAKRAEAIVSPLLHDAVDATASCVLRKDGSATCWPGAKWRDLRRSLDNGTAVKPLEIADAVEIGEHGSFFCARLRNGTVVCRGQNDHGELGDGTTMTRTREVAPVKDLTDVEQLSVGTAHACALKKDATVRCWGWNNFGRLGVNGLEQSAVPVDLGLRDVVEVRAGNAHSCARLRDGTVRCWGDNMLGAVSAGTTESIALPTQVPGISDATQLRVGLGHSCVLRANGEVLCWGSNAEGEACPGGEKTSPTPCVVRGIGKVTQIAPSYGRTCARKDDGAIVCWGKLEFLGSEPSPVEITLHRPPKP